MSENPECPYCGQPVQLRGQFDYDAKARVRCPNCGGTFEYMGGFGAFSIPGEGPRYRGRTARYEGSYPGYDDGTSWREEEEWTIQPPEEPSNACNACCGVCCFCIFMNFLIGFILAFILGGPFWFWFWW